MPGERGCQNVYADPAYQAIEIAKISQLLGLERMNREDEPKSGIGVLKAPPREGSEAFTPRHPDRRFFYTRPRDIAKVGSGLFRNPNGLWA